MIKDYSLHEVLLKVQNVSLTLGNNLILKNINLEVRDIIRTGMTQGQIIGFLGPSGVGKTKLFEILSGLLEPTKGEVFLNDGKNNMIKTMPGLVGVVQQSYPLYEHRTVLGNLMKAAIKHNTKKDAIDKVNLILNRYELSDKKDMYPCQLSGGQKQRVAIGQQLVCPLGFLLLDEPFSGSDISMVRNTCNLISEIGRSDEYITIIIVSHSIEPAAAISDTLWLIGRDRNPDKSIIPGATIQRIYDLKARGLAWDPDIESNPLFQVLITEIKDTFEYL